MPELPSPDHPIQELLFYIVGDVDDAMREKVRQFIDRLANSWPWVIGPPEMEDVVEPAERPEIDAPLVTLGGYIELYCSYPEMNLPREIDMRELEEAEYFVGQIQEFSKLNELEIEFEFDGELIGTIDCGEVDDSLSESLLGEWRRSLESGN